MRLSTKVLLPALALLLAGCATGPGPSSSGQASVVDLHNTKCPVTLDTVGESKLMVTYKGKIYHFCCDDCPTAFNKDPEAFAKDVAADPAKYGVKRSS